MDKSSYFRFKLHELKIPMKDHELKLQRKMVGLFEA
jgi:hypothetical protein